MAGRRPIISPLRYFIPVESTEYAFRVSRMRHAPLPISFPILRPARQMLILRFGFPPALTHNFADLTAARTVTELLVKTSSRIRFKPFFAARTFLETVFVLHLALSFARQCSETGNKHSGAFPFAKTPNLQFPRLEAMKTWLAHRRSLEMLFSHRYAGFTLAS